MLKTLSLRARLTLLSALVMIGVAVALSGIFMVSADRIFVQRLPENLIEITSATHLERAEEPPVSFSARDSDGTMYSMTPSQEADFNTIRITLKDAGQQFNYWGICALFLVAALGIGAIWFIAGRALKPVQELTSTIESIGGNDLTHRVATGNRQDEIGRLARSFNAMMDKVGASYERQRRFSANAAHELKTPLSSMQIGLEVLDLDEHPSPERIEKALETTRANTGRMISLVEDLFLLSTDREYEKSDVVVVSELIMEIIRELTPEIETKNLALRIHAAQGVIMTGNRIMLHRALYNLVENAVKYNVDGGSICLSATQEKDEVTVLLSDTGVGIPDAEQAHVFEPFYRVDQSRSRAVGGSGLGLALVKDIVEKHDGTIRVNSVSGEGTEFVLHFPIKEQE